MKLRQGAVYMEVIAPPPMAHFETTEDVEAFEFPDPLAEGRFDDAEMYIEEYQGEYFIIGDMELTMFDLMHLSVGMEKLLVDMALGKSYVEALIQKTKNFSLAIGKKLVSMGVDGIWAGDDFGGQQGMLISPRMWRKYFQKAYREIYAELKAINPEVVTMQHCDGAVAPILGDWIEVGLEVFNPVQPNVPGHEPEDLKSQFGDRLSFWGAIDQQNLLPFGTPAEIEADVAEKIRVLGAGGGYMCSPAHIVQSDTSMENVEAFIAAVKKHGVYD
jgi:uroporphyrinogen decarboxylase